MSNFKVSFQDPWTTYDNRLIQEETIFKNSTQKLCYMYLLSYARAKKIFPSMDSIAKAICCKKRNTMDIISQLERMGFIEIKKQQGKSNEYTIHNYFEVVEAMTSAKNAPVQNLHQSESPINLSDESTGAKNAPVQNLHQTSAKFAPVEPKPVQNLHPITSTIKSKSKISNKLTSSSLVAFEILDVKLKNKYPNHPFEEIKAKMLEEAENGKCTVATAKQYSSLLEYRLKNYIEPKRSESAQIRTKAPIRTEHLPEDFDKPYEPAEKPHDEDEIERKRMIMDLNLKKFRGEITEEEYKQGIAVLE